MNDILKISNTPVFDESIAGIEIHTYSSFTESYKNCDEIRISIQNQDLSIIPSESFLYIEGTYLKEDGSVSATAKLSNNCVSFLFDQIVYELNGTEIDRSKYVGINSTMRGYLLFSRYDDNALSHTGWSPNTTNPPTVTEGHFNFCVPLKNLLGFASDYRKVVINSRHDLILLRSRNDENAMISLTDKMKIEITKLNWRVPHVVSSDSSKLKMLKIVESNQSIQMAFRSWDVYQYPFLPQTKKHMWTIKTTTQLEKPRYIIFGFQTSRNNVLEKNCAIFDHCNLSDIKVFLNSKSYPYNNLNICYEKNRFALLYDMYAKFQQSYFNSLSRKPWANTIEFKGSFPVAVIDCARQFESLKTAPVDIRCELEFDSDVPASTTAYCIIIHDRIIEYNPLTNFVKKLT